MLPSAQAEQGQAVRRQGEGEASFADLLSKALTPGQAAAEPQEEVPKEREDEKQEEQNDLPWGSILLDLRGQPSAEVPEGTEQPSALGAAELPQRQFPLQPSAAELPRQGLTTSASESAAVPTGDPSEAEPPAWPVPAAEQEAGEVLQPPSGQKHKAESPAPEGAGNQEAAPLEQMPRRRLSPLPRPRGEAPRSAEPRSALVGKAGQGPLAEVPTEGARNVRVRRAVTIREGAPLPQELQGGEGSPKEVVLPSLAAENGPEPQAQERESAFAAQGEEQPKESGDFPHAKPSPTRGSAAPETRAEAPVKPEAGPAEGEQQVVEGETVPTAFETAEPEKELKPPAAQRSQPEERIDPEVPKAHPEPAVQPPPVKLEQVQEELEMPAPLRTVLDLRQPQQVLPKLVRFMETLVTEERSEVRIELKPGHLGEMRIKLAVERGVMVAQFLVENSRVQELISAQLPQLYAALQDQGTVLGDVMIDIGLGQDKLGRENQSQGRAPGRSGQAKAGAKETATAARYLAGSSWHRVDVRV